VVVAVAVVRNSSSNAHCFCFFLRSAEPSHPLLLSVQLLLLLALMLACCTVDQFQKERYFNRFFRGATCITTANEAAELP